MIEKGAIIFFGVAEQYWDKPYVMKAHHAYDVKSVILRGEVIETNLNQIKVKLTDNNGFEKDGKTLIISRNDLLANQNYKDLDSLGKWKMNQ